MTITKEDLALMASTYSGHRPYHTTQAVHVVFDAMREALAEGNRIEIRGFGAFTVKNVKPKPRARNPKTGETISVPARRKVHFRPGLPIKRELDRPLVKGEKVRKR